jgi:membrane associated rhomboid family serine protease
VAYAAVAGALHFGAPITIFAFIAGVLAFHSAFEHRSFRRLTPDQMTLRVREAQSRPPARQGPPRYTQVLAASIALVFVVQLVSVVVPPPYRLPAGVDRWSATALAAGVIKDAVRAGEWWRLLSGTYLHGNLWHFGFNVMALLALGRMVEAFAHRAYVPLVYLLSGIAASVVSQFASPHIDSVGASGAILGLFGFLAVMARRRREMMPPGFGRAIIMDVAVIAAMGVVGLGYIDNWAHAGGFVSGALIGALAIPKGGERPYWEPSRTIRLAGDVSLGILCLAGIATAAVLAWRIYVVFPALAKI